MTTTAGQIIVNDCLPKEFRDYTRVMDSNGIEEVLERIARERPDVYKEVSQKLMSVGSDAAFDNGVTLRLSDCETGFDKKPFLKIVDDAEKRIAEDKNLSRQDRLDALGRVYGDVQASIEKNTFDSELKKRNQLALQVASKARGTKGQLASFISTPGSFPDSNGRTVPMFIRHSFAEGLTPAEYWAGSFGTRTAVVGAKIATAKGGAFGKLLSQSAVNQVITEDDCGGANGVPMPIGDDDNIGAVLAVKTGKYDAGTVITKAVLADLRKDKKRDEIVIRSPMTCGCKSGVCSKCAGIRETGGFPPIGYNLGTNAASAFAERITQGALNCLVEGTLVRMADGSVKPIERIKPGEMVLGSDLNGRVHPTPVVNWYDNGFQECYRTEFKENGAQGGASITLESTIIHKILCTRVVTGQKEEVLNWQPRILPIGTKSRVFCAYTVTSFDDTGLNDEPLAMLLGVLLGDGCYTKSVGGVHLSCADDTEIADLQKSLEGIDLKINRLKYHNGIYYRVSQSGYARGANVIKNYLISNGMYGKFAHDKELPPAIHSWSNKSVGDLIGGFIASDGSVYVSDNHGKPGVSFASTSVKMLEQLKGILLLRFGILGSKITKTGKVVKSLRKHGQYQFTVTKPNEVEHLAAVVTIPGVKSDRLRTLIRNYRKSKYYVRTTFKRISQKPIGLRHVYDIEIGTPEHIFLLANGLIVSNTKHSGRLGGGDGPGKYQGFAMYTSLAKVPGSYPDKAELSSLDGTVENIEDAPQGGKYITVGDGSTSKKHYVAPGYMLLVKKGDTLEAGDQLSDGVINPAELVGYKGIGEARRYWANRFMQGFKDSGMKGNRRNAEVLAKTLINSVELNEEGPAGLPGDVTTYTNWAFNFKPRPDTKVLKPDAAKGMYLEQPVLHYTIGTRITPSVVKELTKFGQPKIFANANKPNVTPFMVRVEDSNAIKDDWMSRLSTTYLKDRLLEDAQRGSEAKLHSTNPYPSLAKGVEFGTWNQPGSKNKTETFTY